ncbi:glycosyltransferase family 2 protein [Streptomyces sp. SHP 1-2]|uniref:glycosyltransferase family 2 protein n=1 Tax=Streptomyces sp. SHP 1-2 TaxID=2769489 RepID=UPI0022387FE7|nr:glycosyltransferase [Streptomyces sp. SHP 1-2]MCW5248933.1 glycosyltransferase [Streptomyces sp. SHP 1-2]
MGFAPADTQPTDHPKVSVIIPVYNAAEHLPQCLQSIVDQSIGFGSVEVVAVDDGSTDGGGALLDAWAERHPGRIRVVHQENSGAPGGPRNRAVAMARGEFLFFADPDDYLGTEGLERMVAAAERNASDVVLGRIKGVGRSAPVTPFRRNVEGGDVFTAKAVWSLTAQKLFRRSLVVEHGLRFAEGLRLAEEQVFVVPAYLLARSISVVADYDCYYLVHRDDFPHLTQQVPDPEPFYGNVRDVVGIVARHVPAGERRNSLLYRWLSLEVLGRFGGRFAALPEPTRRRYMELADELMDTCFPGEVVESLPPLARLRCRLIREGSLEELTALTTLVPRPKQAAKPKPAPAAPAAPAAAPCRTPRRRYTPSRILAAGRRRIGRRLRGTGDG